MARCTSSSSRKVSRIVHNVAHYDASNAPLQASPAGRHVDSQSLSPTGTSTVTQVERTPPSRISTSQNHVGGNRHMQSRTLSVLHGSTRPKNTLLAYTPKQVEFRQYCDYRFPHAMYDSTRYLVDPEKVWDFMWYQSLRECKSRGGNSSRQQVNRFNSSEYDSIIQKYSKMDVILENIHPSKGIGLDTFSMYRSALYSMWDEQKANRMNSYSWHGDIWHAECKKLRTYVKLRIPLQRRRNYVEKLDSNFAPYTVLDSLPKIERSFWDRGVSDTTRGYCSTLASLRNRYVFLKSFSGVLRCESLTKAKLSDLVYLSIRKDQDPHPMQFLILQIATGKYVFVCFFYKNVLLTHHYR
jgi:hypothetical protein